ncbi:MAG: ABC transporter substrate-binding protein, partial [Bacillota bacterium]|nr:ABC transporter substrate-binding protein [Bacillota bacterium]
VEWDGKTKTATAIKGDTVVKLTIGSKIASVTQRGVTQVILDAPATVVKGRTMVPLRLISEAFGAKVTWDDQSRLVRVATGGPTKEELVIGMKNLSTEKKPPEGLGIGGFAQVYEPLLFLNKNLEIQPGLVTSWERLDSLRWRFKLREGVKFHNGKEFDAESVKFAFARLIGKTGYLGGRVTSVVNNDSFGIIDKYTLEIKTLRPFPTLPSLMTHSSLVAIEPEAFAKGEIVGTGPFKFKGEVKDQYVAVERNDEYWGEKPYFKEILFRFIPDDNVRVMALQKGDIDIAIYPPYPLIEELKKEFNIVTTPRGYTSLICFNYKQPALSDEKVRKALCMAIDKNKIANVIYRGYAKPAKTLISPEFIYSAENEIQGVPYNPTEAKRLLQEAGYQDTDNDGFIDKDGKNIELSFPYLVQELCYKEIAETIADWYKEIGVKVNIVTLETAAYSKEVREQGNFDLCLDLQGFFWGAPSTALIDRFYSKSGIVEATSFFDPEIDSLVEKGMEAESWKNLENASETYKRIQKIVMEDKVLYCPVTYLNHIVACKKNVVGLSPFPFFHIFYNGDTERELARVRWVD